MQCESKFAGMSCDLEAGHAGDHVGHRAKFTSADAGCYLDGHLGWHNHKRVIDLAQQYGFTVSDSDRELVEAYDEGREANDGDWAYDVIADLVDAATDYLQSITAEGMVWEWDMGELSLWPTDDES